MKIACPRCACAEITDAPKGRAKTLHCKNGHAFNFEEGLLHFADVVSLARALNHPNRVRLLVAFGHQHEMSATEAGERTGLDTATARYHIIKLTEHDPPLLLFGRKVPNNGAMEQKYVLGRGLREGVETADS